MSKKNTVLRVSSFAYHVGEYEYEFKKTPDSEYVVDDSNFVPIAEAVKQLGTGSSGNSKEQLLYDFPDGKDNGKAIPFSRSAQFKDIAELSSHIADSNEQIQSVLDEQKRMQQFDEKLTSDLPSAPSQTAST